MANKQLPLFPSQPENAGDISKHTPIKATLDLFRQHLLKEGKSEHTVKAFMSDLRLFMERTGEETPVDRYTTTHLNDFLSWMENGRGVPCSRKTYARRVTSLKVYFKWLKALGAVRIDPAAAVLQRSGAAPLSNVLTADQIEAVQTVAQHQKKGDETDYRPELLFELLRYTGIKKSEAGRFKLEHIDRRDKHNPTLLIKHKTKNVYKERRIPVPEHLLTLIDLYIQQYNPKDTLFTCTTRNLEYILTALGEQAGIPFKLSFEVMRWTMAVQDWRDGAEEEEIREKMGLSPISWYETSNKIRRLITKQIEDAQATNNA